MKATIEELKWMDRVDMPKKRAVKRRCVHCRTPLNSYNHNNYCHAHRAQGIKDNMARLAKVAYDKHQVQQKYLEKKRKEKCKAMCR